MTIYHDYFWGIIVFSIFRGCYMQGTSGNMMEYVICFSFCGPFKRTLWSYNITRHKAMERSTILYLGKST